MSTDRTDLRARLEEAERYEKYNARHWREHAVRTRLRLGSYYGVAREELELVAVEDDVTAAVAEAKVAGLRTAIEALNTTKKETAA